MKRVKDKVNWKVSDKRTDNVNRAVFSGAFLNIRNGVYMKVVNIVDNTSVNIDMKVERLL